MKKANSAIKVRAVRTQQQCGFTLMEIVIALALLAMVVSISYSTLNGIMRAKQFLDDGRESQSIANAIITRLTREIQLADPNNGLLPDKNNPSIKYARNINMMGVPQKLGMQEEADSITFMAHGASQYVLGNSNYADVVQITYRVEEDPDQAGNQSPTFFLVREETPLIRPYDRAYKRTMVFPITNRLAGLSFRYLRLDDQAGDRWMEEWGNQNNLGLPAMVEISFKISSALGKIESFTTAVPLRASQ